MTPYMAVNIFCLLLFLALCTDNPRGVVGNVEKKSWELYSEANAIMSSLQLFKLDEINRTKYLDKQNEAISLFETAASMHGNGSAPACFALGSIFSGSMGIPNDDDHRWHGDNAFKYFQMAADQGTGVVFNCTIMRTQTRFNLMKLCMACARTCRSTSSDGFHVPRGRAASETGQMFKRTN